jgi:hypothetical protein
MNYDDYCDYFGAEESIYHCEYCDADIYDKYGTASEWHDCAPEARRAVQQEAEEEYTEGMQLQHGISFNNKNYDCVCFVCNVSFNLWTREGILHRTSQEHAIMLRDKGELCKGITFDGKRFHCAVCGIDAETQLSLKDHIHGKKHLKNFRGVENITPAFGKTENKTKTNKGAKELLCKICNVVANSENEMDDHLQGKRHMKAEFRTM